MSSRLSFSCFSGWLRFRSSCAAFATAFFLLSMFIGGFFGVELVFADFPVAFLDGRFLIVGELPASSRSEADGSFLSPDSWLTSSHVLLLTVA